MRSFTVALDETPASGCALDAAVALAGRFDAALTGLTVLDIDFLTAPQPMPIGGAYYKFKSDLARTLLGLARDCELHAVATHPEHSVAEWNLKQARACLQLYGHDCDAHALISKSDPAQVLIDHVSGTGADPLVMGADRHRGWREALLGSCTTRLLAQCPTSLFIYH